MIFWSDLDLNCVAMWLLFCTHNTTAVDVGRSVGMQQNVLQLANELNASR